MRRSGPRTPLVLALCLAAATAGVAGASARWGGQAPEAGGAGGAAGRVAEGAAGGAEAGLARARAALAAARQRWIGAAEEPAAEAGFARAVRDMEDAVMALRAGLAGASGEVGALEHALRLEDAELKRLLAAMIVAARRGGAWEAVRFHPAGPAAAARAAVLAPAAERGLEGAAAAMGARLDALAAARRLRAEGEGLLLGALEELDGARDALRTAAVARASQPEAGPPAPDSRLAILASTSDTLGELARRAADGAAPAGAAGAATGDVPPREALESAVDAVIRLAEGSEATVTRSSRSGERAVLLERPVAGVVLRAFREPDAGGVALPGTTFAARPGAIVTAPSGGEVRYSGPFLDYNRVVVVATGPDAFVLLAGLAEAVVSAGDHVGPGQVVGFLGGQPPSPQDYLMGAGAGNAPTGAESLYMEVWRAGQPVDPGALLGAGVLSGLGARNG